MAAIRASGRFIGLLLLVVLLGTQLHFLSDLDASPTGTHLCPVCSTLSFAILLALPVLCSLPVMGRAEEFLSVAFVSHDIFRVTSPRAPPLG